MNMFYIYFKNFNFKIVYVYVYLYIIVFNLSYKMCTICHIKGFLFHENLRNFKLGSTKRHRITICNISTLQFVVNLCLGINHPTSSCKVYEEFSAINIFLITSHLFSSSSV